MKKEIREHLYNLLEMIIDAKEEKNLTQENKQIAIRDLIILLNNYYSNVINQKEQAVKNLFNKHQEIWFSVISEINKKVKHKLLDITPGLWRCYIISLFKIKNEDVLLKELTGWSTSMLAKEKGLSHDMKTIILSVNETLKNVNK